jgi:peptidoglycan/LPS O-acetylase OafA/YrhL
MGFVVFLGVILARFLQNKPQKKHILALKILACFLIFNIPNYLKPEFNFFELIKGSQEIFSFEILLPMALLILLSIPLDRIIKSSDNETPGRIAPTGAVAALITLIAIAALNLSGFYSYNLAFLLYGLVGYFLALKLDLHSAAEKQKKRESILALIICIIPFIILAFSGFYDFLFIPMIFAAYHIIAKFLPNNRPLAFLGIYSFYIYIGHIFIIKAITLIIK